eukprot:37223-Eustigmatos_ZCMA.PRE.1
MQASVHQHVCVSAPCMPATLGHEAVLEGLAELAQQLHVDFPHYEMDVFTSELIRAYYTAI